MRDGHIFSKKNIIFYEHQVMHPETGRNMGEASRLDIEANV